MPVRPTLPVTRSQKRNLGSGAAEQPGILTRWRLFALLCGVFALKALVLSQLAGHPLLSPDAGLDTTAYVQLARQVLAGDIGLGPRLYYVSPFYIYFLAAILGLFKSFTAVRAIQIGMGTASVCFIFLMARQWYGERAGWIAASLAALTGVFTFYEVLILQSSVDAFFAAAALWCLGSGLSRIWILPPKGGSSLMLIFAAGLIWGIQTLNRPNVLIAAIGVALVMVIVLRRVKPAALLVAGLIIGMAPVAVRNLVVAHQWTLVSSHGGLNFYIGNNQHATGFYGPVAGVRPAIAGQDVDTRRIAEKALGHPVDDAEASSYFVDLGMAWIREHPLDAAALFVKKLAFTFHASHVPLPQSYAFYAYDTPGILRFLCVGPWLLVPLGLVGAALLLGAFGGPPSPLRGFGETDETRDRGRFVWFSFVPAYAAAVALFFVADRYRLPLMVPLCVCAGGAIDFAVDAVTARAMRRLAIPAAALAVLFAAVNYPAGLDDGRWLEGLRTAERLVIDKRYDDAERWA
jgi:4-amino-4-deoxy-L-arabinose transferase-like glycosyltransferase